MPGGKTPVSTLQEHCQKTQVSYSNQKTQLPIYTYLDSESDVQKLIFAYKCDVEVKGTWFSGRATGKTKKEAKHNSAGEVLKQFQSSLTENFADLETPSNPVTDLDELLRRKNIPLPVFKTDATEDYRFHSECRVAHLRTEANAVSKRMAKREAAKRMIDILATVDEGKLQRELNRMSNVASGLNLKDAPEVSRYRETSAGVQKICGQRPLRMKLFGRLHEDFESSRGGKGQLVDGLVELFRDNARTYSGGWSEKTFSAFVDLCTANSIPVRESKNIEEFYLIVVHLRNPLTFFGIGEKMRSQARQKTLDYFDRLLYNIQMENDDC